MYNTGYLLAGSEGMAYGILTNSVLTFSTGVLYTEGTEHFPSMSTIDTYDGSQASGPFLFRYSLSVHPLSPRVHTLNRCILAVNVGGYLPDARL